VRRAAALLVLSLVVAATPRAAPTQGQVRFESCVGAGHGCAAVSPGVISGVTSLAVSPDGRHLYTSAFTGDAVSAFDVGSAGRLRFDGCVAGGEGPATKACAPAPEGSLENPAGIVAGRGALFVASQRSDAVVRLALSGGGDPTFRDCVGAVAGSCATDGGAALLGPVGLAFGPGDRDLYVASSEGASLTRLRIGAGGLRATGCLAYGGAFGCGRVRKNSLVGADAVAVAPGGRAAYAVAFDSAALTELRRSPSGRLTYDGCIGDDDGSGCRRLPHGTLTGAAGIAVAPDGRDVYIASQVGTVTRFTVSKGGRLAFAGCIGDAGVAGCASVPAKLLAGATGIAVAPDGSTLYVAASGAEALVELSVGAKGAPRLADCFRAHAGGPCRSASGGALRHLGAVATSPDGRSLYTGGALGASVSSFAIPADGVRTSP
jgi:DNA-binding beta-propeller fold protein YncE